MGDFDRAVIDALPAAFIVVDREMHVRVFNTAAERMLGVHPADGMRPGDPRYLQLFHPDGTTPLAPGELPIVRALAGEVVHDLHVVFRSASHPEGRHVIANAGPVRDERGEVVAGVVALADVTDRIAAEIRLEKAERMLERTQKMEAVGRLAGAVAHDFNNLLTVIESYAFLIDDELPAEATSTRECVVEIRRAADRAAGLTRQLLALGRHSPVRLRPLDLDDAVAAVEPVLTRLLGVGVTLAIERGHPALVLADPGQLEQVLMNLVVNARDAIPRGGRVTIETEQIELDADGATSRGLAPGRYAIVSVSDTGAGMDDATQRRIFEPFFTTKDVGKGAGLGLAIVQGIIAQVGGTVSVYSEPGHGTTFRVYLPIATDQVARPAETRVPAPDRLPPITVLVVEDDHQVRGVAVKILEAAGATVHEAASAEEARRLFAAHDPIDVLFSDIVLPDGRGDELCGELLQLRPSMKVVLTSGFPSGALASPTRRLLGKPFGPAEVRAAIAGVLADEASAAETRAAAPPRRQRVLLVDDDDLLRPVLLRFLGSLGFEAVGASGGRAAIAALERERFDVIVSDIQMPDGGGLDLLRSVRRVDLDVPVVLMTGAPDVASATAAVEYGAFRYLAKPLDLQALDSTVRHAARLHALARLRREALSASGVSARSAVDRAGLEVRFDAALAKLWIAFQPIVDARSGAPYAVEALVRSDEWSMPTPDALLDAAAALGRLPHLGRQIRNTSANVFASHADRLVLFVNLHPADLLDTDLLAESSPLARIAKRVVLEVTERAPIHNTPGLAKRLARLREIGFRIAIDDIGAGYSGLTSFADIVPEVVKIDMSLVRDVHLSAVKQRTIRSLCTLCHELGSIVVGEGVETPAERDSLVELGCDFLQGYLFAKPSRDLPQ